MSPRLRKVLPWILYPLFYVMSFMLFAYLTFPFDQLRDRIVLWFAEEERKSGGDKRLEIDRISSYWFSGIEAHSVRLISPPQVKPDGSKGPASELSVERVTARANILPLLIGRVSIDFSAQMLGGTIEGSTSGDSEERTVTVEVADMSVGQIDPLVQAIGLPLTGSLDGTVELTLPESKLSKATGTVDLTLNGLSVGDGKTKIQDAIALPRLVVGELKLSCDISEGRLKISKLAAGGQDLDLSADGKITLRDNLAEARADLYIKFKFSDRYKNKDEKTRALFGAPGSEAPALFELADPRIRRSKRNDGFYSWRASGMLRSLRFDAAPTGSARPSRPGKGGARNPGSVRGLNR